MSKIGGEIFGLDAKIVISIFPMKVGTIFGQIFKENPQNFRIFSNFYNFSKIAI